MNFRLPLMLD